MDLDNPSETVARIPGIVAIDAKSILDTLTSANQPLQLSEKRTALELVAYMKNTELNHTQTRWVHGGANLADGLTKSGANQMLRDFLITCRWSLVHDEAHMSNRKRKTSGIQTLENRKDLAELAENQLRKTWPSMFPSSNDECETENESDYG